MKCSFYIAHEGDKKLSAEPSRRLAAAGELCKKTAIIAIATLLGVLACPAADLKPIVEVAPKAEGTKMQMWPRSAWSEKAACWLVAWREGDITEETSGVWCARVSSDGRALDAQGIRLASGKGLRDRPSVSSDGKDFIVVWEDLRNGKDWDVCGTRVSGDGRILDPEGFLVAGGAHNQCRAVAIFGNGAYVVVFESFVSGKGPAGLPGTGYVPHAVRISAEGKILDKTAVAIGDLAAKVHTFQPFAVYGGKGVLVVSYNRPFGADYYRPSLSGILAEVSASGLPAASGGAMSYTELTCIGARSMHQTPAVVWNGKQFLVGVPVESSNKGKQNDIGVLQIDEQGKAVGKPVSIAMTPARQNKNPCVSLSTDAACCLLTTDESDKVVGCFLSADGGIVEGNKPFDISDAARSMHGYASSGLKGSFLAAWCEVKGVDNLKIVCRLVGPGNR